MKLSDIKTFPVQVYETGYPLHRFTVYGYSQGAYIATEERTNTPLIIDPYIDYTLIVPKKKLHKYLMRSTDSHLPIRPILTFHFESAEEFEYYKNQHSYELISYEGEVEVTDASGV